VGAYCREIEAFLCRRNGGHLVRIVGPAFEMVSGWFDRGVPFKIVEQGVERHLARREARPGARRPARIEFCEADVLEAFDEWRRAVGSLSGVGLPIEDATPGAAPAAGRGPSLPAHLERVQVRLSSLLAESRLPDGVRRVGETLLGRVDAWRDEARGARSEARAQLLTALREADAALLDAAWTAQDDGTRGALRQAAASELAAFRGRMTDADWNASVHAAAQRLLRERMGLPVVSLA
jgi:hypothetical protein